MRAEVPLARGAHCVKVLARHHEHAELDDGVEPEAVRGEAGAKIEDRQLDLLGEVGRDRPVGAQPDLSRDEHELAAGLDEGRVRVRTDGRMHVAGIQERRRHDLEASTLEDIVAGLRLRVLAGVAA